MAKKRKVSARGTGDDDPQEFDPKGGRLGPITTYEDLADSEDEFHINRDKVMLDDGPDVKRRRKLDEEDVLLQPSDEEVLGYASEGSDEDEDLGDTRGKPSRVEQSDQEAGDGNEEEEEEGWGTSRKDYYNADEIQTEADALEEEAEAKRLQNKKLQKMTEADFGFDESEWLDGVTQEEEDRDVVTEVLKDIEITPEMSPDERFRILKSRYPEFEFLADEFVALQPVFVELQQQTEEENAARKSLPGNLSTTVIKCRTLAAYMASLTMYFAILTSPSKDNAAAIGRALDPAELRDHPVMESLLQCRTLWSKVKSLKSVPVASIGSEPESDPESEELSTAQPDLHKVKLPASIAAKRSRLAEDSLQKDLAMDNSLADLDALLPSRKSKSLKPSKSAAISRKVDRGSDSDASDFGEETHLSTKEADQKASRKKTLKFYTSQIAQKANKRLGAGRDAGGDDDLPYRERLRDRQARLNAEAEKRGKKLDSYGRGGGNAKGTELDGDSHDSDEGGRGGKDEDDEYYNMISSTSQRKKAAKQEVLEEAKKLEAANALARVEGAGDLDEDAKRAIGYSIEKNKGLAPKRNKDSRNPRVKKRKKYEEKMKKLGSTRAVWKGGEERGGYGGEKTGIKTGLIKSRKL